MSRPIEPTPVLYGEDARRICEDVANVRFSQERLDEKRECIRIFKRMVANGKKFLRELEAADRAKAKAAKAKAARKPRVRKSRPKK